jgi:hypothetical protein
MPQGVTGMVDAIKDPACATAVGLVLFWSRSHPECGANGHGNGIVFSAMKQIRSLFAKLADFR